MRLIVSCCLWFFSASAVFANCDGRLISERIMGDPVCVPAEPQRIVVLDPLITLGMLMELDAQIAATSFIGIQDEPVRARAEGASIADIGHPIEPSFERILAMQPDLIIGASYLHEALYPMLSQLGPTLLIDHMPWKDHMRMMGEISGREAQAEELLAGYETRLAEVRAKVPSDLTVSVVRVAQEGFRVFLDGPAAYAPYAVLAEAGVKRTAYETTTDQEIVKRPDWEDIGQLTGDVLLYVVASGLETAPDDALTEETLANPLWQMLPAVANGRSHRIDRGTWMGFHGIASAHAVLDDIETFMLP
ncbi:iron-siderophore ABC transporter substrate-binding protein [Paracoccus caeni]|uniref:Iron-siderophore ABC transporter substrate-binding protein n=1 Tax=Paracoccus caeni TaxID=657651 RepID=A0A934SFF0_9RHOB|nr:iron-siderophore ABC transporter substrate-binding protein [Paracoccus caeni]MBK4217911.1 iron-siderophore ABC transporter substrate-binding protein [Paracoccus caeni]